MPEMTALRNAFFVFVFYSIWNPLHGQSTRYPFVHEEYHHVPLFENGQIRVLDVRASEGDTTGLHQHCNPILYITIKGATVSLNEPNGEWKDVTLPTGWIGEDIYEDDSCYVHQFAVIDVDNLQILAIEALSNTDFFSLSSEPIHKAEGFSLFEIGSDQLVEIAEKDIPILMIDSSCSVECEIRVVSSAKLIAKTLLYYNAYAVSYTREH